MNKAPLQEKSLFRFVLDKLRAAESREDHTAEELVIFAEKYLQENYPTQMAYSVANCPMAIQLSSGETVPLVMDAEATSTLSTTAAIFGQSRPNLPNDTPHVDMWNS